VPGIAGEARCGTYEVPENRARPNGRMVPLKVLVLPALGAKREPDPIVSFAGGPGDSAVDEAVGFATMYPKLRERRDAVFIDLRGTGGSAPLHCSGMRGTAGVQGFLDDFLPAQAVRDCRTEHAGRDLAQYRTTVAVDDVAEVLTALGYDKVNAWGGSYGTRSATELARRHPARVRTLALIGLVPPDARSPVTFARDAQDALDATLRKCAADKECAAAFPRVREELAAVLARTEKEPAIVKLHDPDTGAPHELRLTRHGVAQTIRYMLYVPGTAVLVPLYVHAAAEGDFTPLGKTAAMFARFAGGMSDGFFLSVTCSEDVPFIRAGEAADAVRGTFLDDFRIRAQQEACRQWTVPPIPTSEMEPVRTRVPALLISGERDPVTPARWAEQMLRTMPNGVRVVVPDGAHGFDGLRGTQCIQQLLEELVEKGSARRLDTSCVRRISGPPFATKLPPPEVTLEPAQLARIAGRYAGDEGPTIDIEIVGDRLRATIVGEGAFLLTARSPTAFGVEGLPPENALEVVETDGVVTAMRVLGMGPEPLLLKKR